MFLSFLPKFNLSLVSLLAGLTGIALTGCAKDVSLGAKINRRTPAVAIPAHDIDPSTDTPASNDLRHGRLVDTDSQGGDDGNQVHFMSSGSGGVSKVSIGGGIQKGQSVSTHFKVSGGIYVQ